MAGMISGTVLRRDGSPCSGCRVAASIRMGGVTRTIRCDTQGRFVLTWNSSGSIDKLFVEGRTRLRNIKSGEHVVVRLN